MTYEQFCKELKAFCLERGFEISGTCDSEGIYGEITVQRVGQPELEGESEYRLWKNNIFNFNDGTE